MKLLAATGGGRFSLVLPWPPLTLPPKPGFLKNPRQLTLEGRRSGEGYFSADGRKLVFQSEREPGNPFYQIYLMDLETGDTTRVSPGCGKTTCAWVHPDGKRVLFASTHDDGAAQAKAGGRTEATRRGQAAALRVGL